MLGYFFFGQFLIFRVKDYISSGLHVKVTDPDGGIHSTEKKKQFEGTGNERDDEVVEWPKEGWTKPRKSTGVSTLFYIFVSLWREKQRRKKTRGV